MLCLVALSVLMSLSKSCSPAMTWVLLAPRPVQCAAVMTYLGQMMVPPQKGVVPPRLTRAACQGMELGLASLPPTILTESSLLSKVPFFIPFPDQFKWWARVNCRKISGVLSIYNTWIDCSGKDECKYWDCSHYPTVNTELMRPAECTEIYLKALITPCCQRLIIKPLLSLSIKIFCHRGQRINNNILLSFQKKNANICALAHISRDIAPWVPNLVLAFSLKLTKRTLLNFPLKV